MRRPARRKAQGNSIISLRSSLVHDPFMELADRIMERYGMDFDKFMLMPIPTVLALNEIIVRKNKEAEKRMKTK